MIYFLLHTCVLRVLELYTLGFFLSILACNQFIAAILVARITYTSLW
jgi:hypothetical protein